MPTKHNKKRYQAHAKPKVSIVTTGRVFLRYRDDGEIAAARKGDLQLFPSVEALNTIQCGEYEAPRHAGYFKVDVFDGKTWQPVRLTDLFPEREHYFSKTERPADTFALCASLLTGKAIPLTRTYREHYAVENREDQE